VSDPFVDTDVIVRLLAGDDPAKEAASAHLFERIAAGELVVAAPDTVIAEAVFVLSSPKLYRLTRAQVGALLIPLVRLPGFRVANRRIVLRALEVYGATNVPFGDAMVVASMEAAGSRRVYSYDRHFDAVPGVERHEPPITPGAQRNGTEPDD
jgi:predicted nucleic acid-binding protein